MSLYFIQLTAFKILAVEFCLLKLVNLWVEKHFIIAPIS